MDLQSVITELETRQAAIATERDKLRDYIWEIEGLEESCNRAYDALYEAIDALSELV